MLWGNLDDPCIEKHRPTEGRVVFIVDAWSGVGGHIRFGLFRHTRYFHGVRGGTGPFQAKIGTGTVDEIQNSFT